MGRIMIGMGEFQVDINERRIYAASGAELPVEPKVIDVLCYLMQHHERYVSLQELHDQVWAGRIVTDTAVRRTISKLRAILGDTDQETPRYIKSQMKRGYQFIALLQPIAEPQPQTPADSMPASFQQMAMPSPAEPSSIQPLAAQSKAANRHFRKLAVVALLLGIGVVIVLTRAFWQGWGQGWGQEWRQESPALQLVLSGQPLVDIAGEKSSYAVSDNGRFHTFNARLPDTEVTEPYLYDMQLGQLQRIPYAAAATYTLVAPLNSDTLAVSTVQQELASLSLFAATDLRQPLKTIPLPQFADIGQATSYLDNRLFINARRKGEQNGLYYLLDLDSAAVSQFTFSSEHGVIDKGAVVSPDKTWLGLIRMGTDTRVQIYRIADQSISAEIVLKQNIRSSIQLKFNLVWLNNSELLFSHNGTLSVIHAQNGSQRQLPQSMHFTGLGRDMAGNFFGLHLQPQQKEYLEVALHEKLEIQRYLSFGDSLQSLRYSNEPGKLWLVEKVAAGYQLSQFAPDTGEKKPFLTLPEPFAIVNEARQQPYLLLVQNQQLKKFNFSSGALQNVSFATQKVWWGADTSADGSTIYFTERVGDDFIVNQFDNNSGAQQRILKDVRQLIPWQNQFVAVSSVGQLSLLDAKLQVIKPLPHQFNVNYRHHVSLRGDQLTVFNLNAKAQWLMTQLDLNTGKAAQQVFKTLPIESNFALDPNGRTAIVTKENKDKNQLVKIEMQL